MALAIDLGASTIKIFGCDQRVRGLANYARTLWLRGFSEKALSMAQQAINEAEHQDHPVSLCLSLTFGSGVFLWTGDLPRANGLIDRLIAYAGQYSLDPYHAVGTALSGALAIARNEAELGVGLLRTALKILQKEQYNVLMPEVTGALAECLQLIGHFKEALHVIDGIIKRVTDSGATFYLAELIRIKARILSCTRQPGCPLTVNCLSEAITIAGNSRRSRYNSGWQSTWLACWQRVGSASRHVASFRQFMIALGRDLQRRISGRHVSSLQSWPSLAE
jgi:MalT-like TPR region